MKSNHGFQVKSCYPASAQAAGYFPAVSYGDLYFIEPETQSDQRRLTSIIRTGDSTGYYVDIFRSRRRDGQDKMHDYFYRNMGQQVTLTDRQGALLPLQPTEELSFSGGHLFAYDYFWDKKAIATEKDAKAVFNLQMPGKPVIQMNMWIKGEKDRTLFAVKAPISKSIGRMGLPDSIAHLPLPTIVARQRGEAWTKPFVVVFEPATGTQPAAVQSVDYFRPAGDAGDFTGVVVTGRRGDRQYIWSAAEEVRSFTHIGMMFTGTYAVVSENSKGLQYLFIGHGQSLSAHGYSLRTVKGQGSAALSRTPEGWFITAPQPVILTVPAGLFAGKTILTITVNGQTKRISGKPVQKKGQPQLRFELPAMPYSKLEGMLLLTKSTKPEALK